MRYASTCISVTLTANIMVVKGKNIAEGQRLRPFFLVFPPYDGYKQLRVLCPDPGADLAPDTAGSVKHCRGRRYHPTQPQLGCSPVLGESVWSRHLCRGIGESEPVAMGRCMAIDSERVNPAMSTFVLSSGGAFAVMPRQGLEAPRHCFRQGLGVASNMDFMLNPL